MAANVLYWGRDWNMFRPRSRCRETHPYAQLEICAGGRIAVRKDNGVVYLTGGDCLLIPPGVRHGCFYPAPNNEFYSLKFESDRLPKQLHLHRADDFTRWFLTGLRNCHRPEQRLALPLDDSNREILNGITEMMLSHMMRPVISKNDEAEPPIFAAIRDTVLRCGAYINVSNCAELLGTDAAKLNYRFAKELKTYRLSPEVWSVKKIIDGALAEEIKKYLIFTELSVSEIAEQMKFNNLYTFSRFFRRLEGCSPREWRKRSGLAAGME